MEFCDFNLFRPFSHESSLRNTLCQYTDKSSGVSESRRSPTEQEEESS